VNALYIAIAAAFYLCSCWWSYMINRRWHRTHLNAWTRGDRVFCLCMSMLGPLSVLIALCATYSSYDREAKW
jgi:hypothetical protein